MSTLKVTSPLSPKGGKYKAEMKHSPLFLFQTLDFL